MPDLDRWPDADALLDRALELPRAERSAFVRAAAGGDDELAAALEDILREDGPPGGFLEPGGALHGPLADDFAADDEVWGELTLADGVALGPYRVDRQIGRGGMGEVYLARDLRLGRDVALKILPRRLALDPDRVARFEREARALAAVNHPGIGTIYDVHEEPGLVALVLELVDGPTLADQLASGPIPFARAIAIARQLADAIAAAHERGIVHRDLKPGNVKVRADGTVKVLDFGLARAIAGDSDVAPEAPGLSPITTLAERPGLVFGTAAYMSPEQARGQRVDHRTDNWAFGCLLFEMLSGERAFAGETQQDILARVLEREPDYHRLPADVPAALVRLIRRCLQKDPAGRLAHIGDARFDLDEALADTTTRERPAAGRPGVGRRVAIPVAAAAALVIAAIAVAWMLGREPAPRTVVRLAVPLTGGEELVVGQLPALAMASSGGVLVYRAREGGTMRLFVRRLDAAAARPIPGTENAGGHAVSPDGRWVAFGRDGRLFKASLAGGSPVALCDAPGGSSIAWAVDDTIVFTTGTVQGLQRVPAAGGRPAPQTTIDPARGDAAHLWPAVSPDGRTLAFTIATASRHLVAVAARDGTDVRILGEGRQPQFLAADVLVFAREDGLWAARLDASRRSLAGEPAVALDGVERSTLNGFVHFAVSPDGSLVYIPERVDQAQDALVWIDRRGKVESTEVEARSIVRFALSREGSHIALAMSDPDTRDVWVYDRRRRSLGRLTSDPASDTAPVWTPDGRRIAFRSDRDGGGVFLAPADGSGAATRLTRAGGLFHTPYTFTPDGSKLLYVEFRDYRDQNIFSVTTATTVPQVEPVLTGDFAEVRPAISPDGRWLAYQSDESGRFEIYVRPYPDVQRARWQVSTAGGSSPAWRGDGRELFFTQAGRVVAAAITPGNAIRAGVPVPLFTIDAGEDRLGALFEVTPDGRRFLVRRAPPAGSVPPAQLHVILNWQQSLPALRGGS